MRWMKCWTRSARRDRLGRVAHLLLLFALLTGTAAAGVSQDAPCHSQSNVVVIPALVKSAKGEIVYGLGAKVFVVEDAGVEQPVRLDEAAGGPVVSVVGGVE